MIATSRLATGPRGSGDGLDLPVTGIERVHGVDVGSAP